MSEVEKLINDHAEALRELDASEQKRKETAKDFETAFRVLRKENDQLSADLADARQKLAEKDTELERLRAALAKINVIRNSIVAFQSFNFSEHAYPLVAALNEAGIEGMDYPEALQYFGSMLERTNKAEAEATDLRAQRDQAVLLAKSEGEIIDWMEKQLTTGSGMIAHNLWHGKTLRQDVREQMAKEALSPPPGDDTLKV